jgi:hypothetical protein
MKTLVFRVTLLTLLLLCLISQTFAAGKGKGKAPKKAVASVEVPFDNDIEKLPAKFRGNNPITIYSALLKNAAKYQKSEFETNDAFQEKLERLDESPLVGKLKYNSTVAIPLLTSFKSSYDADSKTMTVSIPLTSIQDSDLSEAITYELPGKGMYSYAPETVSGNAIEVFTTLSESKKYTGSNAFGVKVKITGKLYDTFALAVKNDHNLMNNGGVITLNIPMPPDKAREAKAAGNILLVGELLYPYLGHGTYHSTATINEPVETLDRIRYVAMELTGIWYYSIKNGDVYHKTEVKYNEEAESNE